MQIISNTLEIVAFILSVTVRCEVVSGTVVSVRMADHRAEVLLRPDAQFRHLVGGRTRWPSGCGSGCVVLEVPYPSEVRYRLCVDYRTAVLVPLAGDRVWAFVSYSPGRRGSPVESGLFLRRWTPD
jgi:hypothetical protein